MTSRTYLRPSAGTFFTSGEVTSSHAQAYTTIPVRTNSDQATSVGVHVKGNMKVQKGKVANSMSVMLDPTAIRRKIAIEQMNRDLQGSGGSTTTKR
jgi:hypothetical protein